MIVVPVTGNTRQVFPFQTLLPAVNTRLRLDSKAQAEQIRSVTVDRLGPVVARLPPSLMAELDDALRLHLHLYRRCTIEPGIGTGGTSGPRPSSRWEHGGDGRAARRDRRSRT